MDRTISEDVLGAVIAISLKGSESYLKASGNLKTDTQYFIASATKLYVTALILTLVDAGKLKMDDKIHRLLPAPFTKELHIYQGKDYSSELSVEHLMAHTSGLPDYFQALRYGRESLMEQILRGADQSWYIETVVADSKSCGALFPPTSGKAHYSDTNYQLLGRIIEETLGCTFADAVQRHICAPLGLEKTYVYQDENDQAPATLTYQGWNLHVPKAMASFGPDGGIVSTAFEGMVFLKAFFEGHLFKQSHIDILTKEWRKIFFPLRYGIGLSLFRVPWFFSPFKRFPDLIGHSGLSGAFAFYCPAKDLYMVGTTNQLSKPQASFQLMIKMLNAHDS